VHDVPDLEISLNPADHLRADVFEVIIAGYVSGAIDDVKNGGFAKSPRFRRDGKPDGDLPSEAVLPLDDVYAIF
jgi:hypothetical protein